MLSRASDLIQSQASNSMQPLTSPSLHFSQNMWLSRIVIKLSLSLYKNTEMWARNVFFYAPVEVVKGRSYLYIY